MQGVTGVACGCVVGQGSGGGERLQQDEEGGEVVHLRLLQKTKGNHLAPFCVKPLFCH